MSDKRHDAVSRRAYELWEQEGGEHGRHDEHWHRATQELEASGEGGGDDASEVGGANVTAPDGTTMPIATAAEVMGVEQQAPARTPRKRAAAAPGGPAPTPAPSPAAKSPAKPRKPKAK